MFLLYDKSSITLRRKKISRDEKYHKIDDNCFTARHKLPTLIGTTKPRNFCDLEKEQMKHECNSCKWGWTNWPAHFQEYKFLNDLISIFCTFRHLSILRFPFLFHIDQEERIKNKERKRTAVNERMLFSTSLLLQISRLQQRHNFCAWGKIASNHGK